MNELNADLFAAELGSRVRFCKPCEIWIGACDMGFSVKHLTEQAIADATGCTVYAPTGGIYNGRGKGRVPLGVPQDPGSKWWRTRPRLHNNGGAK